MNRLQRIEDAWLKCMDMYDDDSIDEVSGLPMTTTHYGMFSLLKTAGSDDVDVLCATFIRYTDNVEWKERLNDKQIDTLMLSFVINETDNRYKYQHKSLSSYIKENKQLVDKIHTKHQKCDIISALYNKWNDLVFYYNFRTD